MTLLTAHRILIATAVAFFVFYAGWELLRQGAAWPGSALRAGASLIGAAALAVYLGSLRGSSAPRGPEDRGGTR